MNADSQRRTFALFPCSSPCSHLPIQVSAETKPMYLTVKTQELCFSYFWLLMTAWCYSTGFNQIHRWNIYSNTTINSEDCNAVSSFLLLFCQLSSCGLHPLSLFCTLMNITMTTRVHSQALYQCPFAHFSQVMLHFFHHTINSYTWRIKLPLRIPLNFIFPLLWHLITCTTLPSLINRFLKLKLTAQGLLGTSWLPTQALLLSGYTLLSNGRWASYQLKNWETRDQHGKHLKKEWWELTVVMCISKCHINTCHLILHHKQGFHGRLHLPRSTKISHR